MEDGFDWMAVEEPGLSVFSHPRDPRESEESCTTSCAKCRITHTAGVGGRLPETTDIGGEYTHSSSRSATEKKEVRALIESYYWLKSAALRLCGIRWRYLRVKWKPLASSLPCRPEACHRQHEKIEEAVQTFCALACDPLLRRPAEPELSLM